MSDAVRVGVEVGGTFTDLVAFEKGGVRITKVPSTPPAPHRGAIAALDESGLALADAGDLVHGSTVATNAVLERKGAKVAFFATEGFRDLLTLQRQSRRSIYDIHYRKPEPVVPRRDTFEIPERIGAGRRSGHRPRRGGRTASHRPGVTGRRLRVRRDLLPEQLRQPVA